MAERMEDLEDGEITDSDTDSGPKPSLAAPATVQPTAQPRGQNQPKKPAKLKVPGLSSDEDDGNSSDDDIPFKKQFQQQQPKYSDEEDEEFQNPLRAAHESGFECDRNYWLEGAFQSTKRGGASSAGGRGGRKRVNNIWGSVLQEEELSKGMGGLQNNAEALDERGMGVESYDWRRSQADTRPYTEHEEHSNEEENPEVDLEAKESFGTLKTKPRRMKERLGKRTDSDDASDDTDTEPRKSAKSRLGSRTNSEDSNGKKHRNSPIDPTMDDNTSPGKLEHRKLHDRIQEHHSKSSTNGRGDSRRRQDNHHRHRHSDDRRDEKIQQNRKRRAEATTVNQRKKAVQYVPMKAVEINVDMDADTIAEKLVESLGEPDDKKINFARAVQLVGAETVLKLYRATEDVEEMGGLTIQNGVRRRTPGGVFFFLMKNDKAFPKSIMDQIFQEDREAWKRTCQERKKANRQREKERLRKLKEQQEGENFEDELKSYANLKKEVSSEDTKDKDDEMEMEEAKGKTEREEKQESGIADDLFDAYAEEIELDVM